ncbi:MAG: hypothetical protein C0392_04445 [Syntrophus sp. (in: bacteria)]|nr:hypothetical protein [Syntrophus sp. (in: bacteria)]
MPAEKYSISRILQYLFSYIYSRQVIFMFPVNMLRQFLGRKWSLPEGFSIGSPDETSDLQAWADLLNSDKNFGEWTVDKMNPDILAHLIAPDAASLLFYKQKIVGCFCTYDRSTPDCKIGLGMWFIIDPAHRGKDLSRALCFRTLAYFAREDYKKVLMTTDSFRLSALSFYLTNGAKPVYASFFSVIQWWIIRKRLRAFKRNKPKLKTDPPVSPPNTPLVCRMTPHEENRRSNGGSGVITIKEIRKATSQEWDRIWSSCDYATYFHSREWAEIWEKHSKDYASPCPRMVIFSDNKNALLPLSLQKRKGFIKNYFLTAEGNFGNWISEYYLTGEHITLLTEYLTNHVGNLIWRWNPYDGCGIHINPDDIFELEEDETYVIDLRDGYERVFKECSHGHQCSARKAEREGVAIRCAETEGEWQSYFAAYEDSLDRWGESALSRFTWGFFHGIFSMNSPYIKLWLATYDSEVIGGALCFYSKRHVVCWHASTFGKFFNMRPVNLLMLEIIKDSCEKGFSWFDFNTSSHIDGVRTFKKRFGALELPCHVVYQKTGFVKSYIFIKKRMMGIVER